MPTSESWSLKRERFLIQHEQTHQYLAGAQNGILQWTPDPHKGFRFSLMETVQEQIRAIRHLYKVPNVRVASIVFQVDPNNPDRLDAWEIVPLNP